MHALAHARDSYAVCRDVTQGPRLVELASHKHLLIIVKLHRNLHINALTLIFIRWDF